jgi:hypothetical protein
MSEVLVAEPLGLERKKITPIHKRIGAYDQSHMRQFVELP